LSVSDAAAAKDSQRAVVNKRPNPNIIQCNLAASVFLNSNYAFDPQRRQLFTGVVTNGAYAS
jgi:hypothetical protein